MIGPSAGKLDVMKNHSSTSKEGKWFRWTLLDPDPTRKQIRLLTLPKGTISDPIQYRLEHVDLNNCKPYEALSYEWGPLPQSPADEKVIEINGSLKRIRQNLFNALLHIRLQDRDRYIWIDALCLNQDEEDDVARAEKKRSIMMMGDIYRSATSVVVWLGSGTSDSDKAIACINEIHQNLPSSETTHVGFGWINTNLGSYDDGGEQLVSNDTLETIYSLCQRSYWTRVWMIQELHLGAKLEIYCGTSRTTDAAFESAMNYLYKDRRIKYDKLEQLTHSIPFDFHFNYRQPAYKKDPRKLTFSFWIAQALEKGFACYKPHDIAYALRGQSYRISDEEIVPDYKKCMECLFTDTLVAWATGNLEAEYGSSKFVTRDEAMMLANRLLPGRKTGDILENWVEYNEEQFDALYRAAQDEWWEMRTKNEHLYINQPWHDGVVGNEEEEFRKRARKERLALLRQARKR